MSEQTKVRVSFDYYPDEPDDQDATGMSESEFERLMDGIAQLGGDDMACEKVGP